MSNVRPDTIGCYAANGALHFYGATHHEMDRSAFALARVIRTFGLPPGSNILVISMIAEIVQFAPFERAVQMLGHYGLNADDSPFDAGRVESIARQFNPVAICGVAASTLEGLKAFGHDPARVFADRIVWARPDAYGAVASMPDVTARRMATIGPAIAIECARGGLHYDDREWAIDEAGGALRVSSRLPRVEPLVALETGVRGGTLCEPCACGVAHGVLRLSVGSQ